MGDPVRLAAARRSRYAAREREADPEACRANERRRDLRQRLQLIAFLGGCCATCGLRDARGLVVVQPAGERMTLHQLYTYRLHEPEAAAAQLRLVCATCRRIEQYEAWRARYPHDPSVEPSMSSPDVHPSVSDDHPSSSAFDTGAARATWACWSDAAVAFG